MRARASWDCAIHWSFRVVGTIPALDALGLPPPWAAVTPGFSRQRFAGLSTLNALSPLSLVGIITNLDFGRCLGHCNWALLRGILMGNKRIYQSICRGASWVSEKLDLKALGDGFALERTLIDPSVGCNGRSRIGLDSAVHGWEGLPGLTSSRHSLGVQVYGCSDRIDLAFVGGDGDIALVLAFIAKAFRLGCT